MSSAFEFVDTSSDNRIMYGKSARSYAIGAIRDKAEDKDAGHGAVPHQAVILYFHCMIATVRLWAWAPTLTRKKRHFTGNKGFA